MNQKAPISEFPHWCENEKEGCAFDLIGKFRNDAPTAWRDICMCEEGHDLATAKNYQVLGKER